MAIDINEMKFKTKQVQFRAFWRKKACETFNEKTNRIDYWWRTQKIELIEFIESLIPEFEQEWERRQKLVEKISLVTIKSIPVKKI